MDYFTSNIYNFWNILYEEAKYSDNFLWENVPVINSHYTKQYLGTVFFQSISILSKKE